MALLKRSKDQMAKLHEKRGRWILNRLVIEVLKLCRDAHVFLMDWHLNSLYRHLSPHRINLNDFGKNQADNPGGSSGA